jgi:polyisoprenoid-binding protein YceI
MTIATNIATEARPTTAASASPGTATRWQIDPSHSSAQFKARHLMVSHVRGELGPVSGEVVIDEADLGQSRATANIDARGLDSKFAKRDEHLRSADFLDVEHHPFVTFRSTRVVSGADGGLKVTGDLTIRGVTRPITLDVDPLPPAVNDPWGNTKRGATARTHFDRKDWGLAWNLALETGGVLVGDRIDVEIELELIRA